MNAPYSATFPSILHAGPNSRAKTLETAKLFCQSPRICLVASASALASDPGQELLHDLTPYLTATFTGVKHDPTVETVDEIRRIIGESEANMVVVLGGGSPMDAAKAAAFLALENQPTADYLNGRATVPAAGIPCIALPTTAGTGAEITKNAVLSDHEANVKMSLRGMRLAPVAAICDPDFTLGLPPAVTANSGMDALTQALESFLSRRATELTRPLAAHALKTILQYLPIAYEHPHDQQARNQLAEASMLTAMAFAQSSLGSVHGLAHPIGHLLDLPHGFTCAVLLPHCFHFNLLHDPCKLPYEQLAKACDLEVPIQLYHKITDLNRQMGIPDSFAQAGLKKEHLDYIINNCRSGSMKANPITMTDQEILCLLQNLMG